MGCVGRVCEVGFVGWGAVTSLDKAGWGEHAGMLAAGELGKWEMADVGDMAVTSCSGKSKNYNNFFEDFEVYLY